MSRRTGLLVLCVALVFALSIFAYNIYSSMHLPFFVSNALSNNTCNGGACSTVHVTPTQEPTALPVTPTPTKSSLALPGYKLAWNDEFDGTQLDASKWYAINNAGGESQQSCCLDYSYSSLISPSQLQIHDGMLTIKTERSSGSGKAYKTGAITTETLSGTPTYTFTYGRIDIRAKLPAGKGVWPAMWLVTSPATVQVSYEIDMMEMLGQDPHTLYQVIHHSGNREYCQDKGPDYSQGFHVYTLDWEPGKLTWLVDGQTLCTVIHYVPSQPMYLIINTALSGGSGAWGAVVNSATPLPQTFDLDYVRIYKHV